MAIAEVGPGGHLLTAWNLADVPNPAVALANLGAGGNTVVTSLSDSTQRYIQFGSFSPTILSGTSQIGGSVSFGQAFPTVCDAVFLNVQANTHNYAATANTYTVSGFNFDMFTTNAGNVGVNVTWTVSYVAIGH